MSPNLKIVSSTNSSVTVAKHGLALPGDIGIIEYEAASNNCEFKSIANSKVVIIDRLTPFLKVVGVQVHDDNTEAFRYQMTAFPPIPKIEGMMNWHYQWELYNNGVPVDTIPFVGHTITTPWRDNTGGADSLSWTLNITDEQDSTHQLQGAVKYLDKMPIEDVYNDSNHYYLAAEIDDMDLFDTTVRQRILQHTFEDGVNEQDVYKFLCQIEMEELEPYLLLDSNNNMIYARSINNDQFAQKFSGHISTKLWPNPASNRVNFIPGSRFNEKQIIIEIYDFMGRLILNRNISAISAQTIDAAQLANGSYIVKQQQEGYTEQFKLIMLR